MTRCFELAAPPPEETAFVIANGPSLAAVDLKRLPRVATFGMNAAYRHWQRIGWWPTHYACLDEVVGLSHAEAVKGMLDRAEGGAGSQLRAFLLRRNLIEALGRKADGSRLVDFDTRAATDRAFARTPVTTGSHCLIWALALGYKTIFLLGADCSYVEVVGGAERVSEHVLEIVRHETNPNYFIDDYQRVGDRFHYPNVGGPTHLRSWRGAAAVAAEMGAQVYNLSPQSRVDVFDFASLDDVLAGRTLTVQPIEKRVAGC